MAETKTTYPDGNTTTKRDANVPNQGGVNPAHGTQNDTDTYSANNPNPADTNRK